MTATPGIDPALTRTLDPGEFLHDQLAQASLDLMRELLATFGEHHGQSPVPVLRVALVSGEMLMIDLRELGQPSQVLDCQGR